MCFIIMATYLISDSKVGETTGKTASADFVDHGVGLDDDQGVGFVLPFDRRGHHVTR